MSLRSKAGGSGVAAALLRFALVATVAFCVLVLPSETRREVWGAWFRASGELFLSPAWLAGDIELRLARGLGEWVGPGGSPDTAVLLDGRAAGYVDSASMGYLPMAVLVALLLATPRGLGNRVRGWLLGGFLVHLFIAARLGSLVFHAVATHANQCAGSHEHGALLSSDWMHPIAYHLHSIVNVEIPLGFTVPALIWLATTFRGGDLFELLRRVGRHRPASAGEAASVSE